MDKFDVEEVNNWSKDYVINNKKEILEWLQDSNWPISRAVVEIVIQNFSEFYDEVLNVLKGGHIEWRMNIILGVLSDVDKVPEVMLTELKQILKKENEHDDVKEAVTYFFKKYYSAQE